uniref:WIYLD domain-containing protein n=1 Tax=Oryza punctata TaxID=4537 RepID=A0A0E0LYB0_ORYPU
MVWPGRGQRRIDAAIDHLSEYGFPRPIIRQAINELLADTLYGRDGWVFLEEGSYRIVVDKLLEEQANQQQQEDDAKHEGGTTAGEPLPENGVQTSQAEVPAAASEPAKVVAAVAGELPDSTTSVPLPVPAARHTASTRRPCYGWLIESESEDDELDNGVSAVEQFNTPTAPNHKMSNGWSYVEQARPPVVMRCEMKPDTHRGGMLPKRRRPSGWDYT